MCLNELYLYNSHNNKSKYRCIVEKNVADNVHKAKTDENIISIWNQSVQ